MEHKKRRRRRKTDRLPISAWLRLSDELKTDIGLLSNDICVDLFGTSFTRIGANTVRYVAISPWYPSCINVVEEAQWTVLPIRAQSQETGNHSTLQFPSSSAALETFATHLRLVDALRARPSNKDGKNGIEIRIIDVEPLILDRIFITVDGEALNRHDDVQEKFGGGFHSQANGHVGKDRRIAKPSMVNGGINGYSQKLKEPNQEDRLTTAVRRALESPLVVRQGDLLALPLPTHPITHVSLPPARITFCEPVEQGLLASTTKVVVNREHNSDTLRHRLPKTSSRTKVKVHARENDVETTNEQFYSTAEDGLDGEKSEPEEGDSSSSPEEPSDSESSSDDSASEPFPVGASHLTSGSFGFDFSTAAAHPRTGGISTPGSVHSNFTATTARQSARQRGKVFKPRTLRGKIPDEMLNPRPSNEEDEEARIYVDIKTLMKLGIFSGDWAKVQTTPTERKDHWAIDAFEDGPDTDDFRVAKVYGLPGLSPAIAPRDSNTNSSIRRSSLSTITSSLSRSVPDVWLSPILLSNLGNPSALRLSRLTFAEQHDPGCASRQYKIIAASTPPIAKELTLLMVSTPLVTEQAVQSGLMAATKKYFQIRLRILRQGDLVPIVFDAAASRLLSQASSSSDSYAEIEEILSAPPEASCTRSRSLAVAWFRVQGTIAGDVEKSSISANTWGSMVSIDPTSTRMAQAGNEWFKILSRETAFEIYLGTRPPPRTSRFKGVLSAATATASTPYISPLRRRLRELMAATTSPRAMQLGMDPIFILLHSTQRNIGKATLATSAISDLGCHTFVIDAYELLSEGGTGGGDVKTEGIFQARIERALTCGPKYTAILIRHIEELSSTRMISAFKFATSSCRMIIATTTEIDQLPDTLRNLFTHELEVSAPDENERCGLLNNIVLDHGLSLAHDVDLSSLALKSAALVAGDLSDIIDRAITARTTRLESLLITNRAPNSSPIIRDILVSTPSAHVLTSADFDTALSHARASFATSIGAPKIPSVQWSDVGGLAHVKDAIMETIHLPLSRPELFSKGLKKRSGILLYGPPGTGKTLLAKAIATEFSLNFFSVKGPELLNMYIGESEANVRRVFQKARDARPCVVFFDELDSVAPKRGNQGDSGGVMDRIVSQLLAELDGMSDGEDGGKGGVFVIGATNRPDLLDAALLRPGRFDKMLYLGIPDTHEKQLTILQALTRKFKLDPDLQLDRVTETLPFTYTGADLYALASDAMLKAITRRADAVDAKIKALPGGEVSKAYFFDHLATEEDISVTVTEADFDVARKGLVGSVNAKELEHYVRVRKAFEGPERAKNQIEGKDVSRPIMPSIPTTIWDGDQGGVRVKSKGKGKARATDGDDFKGKGKGKATWDSSDEEDEAYETSLDFQNTPERRPAMRFRDKNLEDEESLYE